MEKCENCNHAARIRIKILRQFIGSEIMEVMEFEALCYQCYNQMYSEDCEGEDVFAEDEEALV